MDSEDSPKRYAKDDPYGLVASLAKDQAMDRPEQDSEDPYGAQTKIKKIRGSLPWKQDLKLSRGITEFPSSDVLDNHFLLCHIAEALFEEFRQIWEEGKQFDYPTDYCGSILCDENPEDGEDITLWLRYDLGCVTLPKPVVKALHYRIDDQWYIKPKPGKRVLCEFHTYRGDRICKGDDKSEYKETNTVKNKAQVLVIAPENSLEKVPYDCEAAVRLIPDPDRSRQNKSKLCIWWVQSTPKQDGFSEEGRANRAASPRPTSPTRNRKRSTSRDRSKNNRIEKSEKDSVPEIRGVESRKEASKHVKSPSRGTSGKRPSSGERDRSVVQTSGRTTSPRRMQSPDSSVKSGRSSSKERRKLAAQGSEKSSNNSDKS